MVAFPALGSWLTVHSPTSGSPCHVPTGGDLDYDVSWDVTDHPDFDPDLGVIFEVCFELSPSHYHCNQTMYASGDGLEGSRSHYTGDKEVTLDDGTYNVRFRIYSRAPGCTTSPLVCRGDLLEEVVVAGGLIVGDQLPTTDSFSVHFVHPSAGSTIDASDMFGTACCYSFDLDIDYEVSGDGHFCFSFAPQGQTCSGCDSGPGYDVSAGSGLLILSDETWCCGYQKLCGYTGPAVLSIWYYNEDTGQITGPVTVSYTIAEAVPDTDPPQPNPSTWELPPTALSSTSIEMAANHTSDPSGVEFYFDCTSGGGHDSGWQDDDVYTDTGLSPDTQYCYRVCARDKSADQNTASWSSSACESTPQGAGDITPPTPNPPTWDQLPSASSSTSISMSAQACSDPSGVEYYFEETSGNPGGSDSGWQDGIAFTDSGLDPNIEYCYRVKSRDKSANQNMSSWSTAKCATSGSCSISSPNQPKQIGNETIVVGIPASFEIEGSVCSSGHAVEYRLRCTKDTIDWVNSGWTGTLGGTITLPSPGIYDVYAQARCVESGSTSLLSDSLEIEVRPQSDGTTRIHVLSFCGSDTHGNHYKSGVLCNTLTEWWGAEACEPVHTWTKTIEDLEDLVVGLADRADGDDVVVFHFTGHGNSSSICTQANTSVNPNSLLPGPMKGVSCEAYTYSALAHDLLGDAAATIAIFDNCEAGGALPHFDRPRTWCLAACSDCGSACSCGNLLQEWLGMCGGFTGAFAEAVRWTDPSIAGTDDLVSVVEAFGYAKQQVSGAELGNCTHGAPEIQAPPEPQADVVIASQKTGSGGATSVRVVVGSPVDAVILDPLGRELSADRNEIGLGAIRIESAPGEDGTTGKLYEIAPAIAGTYSVEIRPDVAVPPGATYDLLVQESSPHGSSVWVLLENAPIEGEESFAVILGEGLVTGDLDGDGAVTALDVRLCYQIVTGDIVGSPVELLIADVDDDGDVDMEDAVILAEYVIGIRDELP